MMRWMWNDAWQSGWVGLLMGLMMLLFWGVVIAAIYYVIRLFIREGNTTRSALTPVEILKKRYAKGEINEADYDRMKSKLEEK